MVISRLIKGIIFIIVAVFLIILGVIFTVSIVFSFVGIPLIIIGILLIIVSIFSIVFGTAGDVVRVVKKPFRKNDPKVIEVENVDGVYVKR